MILNGTNFDGIVEETGEEDSDDWPSKKITLYSAQVPFGPKMVDAIRIRISKKATKSSGKKADKIPF